MLMRLHYEFCIEIPFLYFLERLKMDKRIYYIRSFTLCNLVMSKLLFLSKHRSFMSIILAKDLFIHVCVYLADRFI
jgi:hypothetical protein